MDLEIFDQTEKFLNIPLIDIKLIENKHLIFVKYTSELYYKYSIELIETLCKKSKSENKKLLFYTSLNFLLKILYNSGNTPCLNNLDLLILCSFYLGIKSIERRFRTPSINGLKRIYPEKYHQYQNSDIKLGEIICLKLLDYNINILTPYECLFYLLNKRNNLNLFDHCIQHLDNLVISGDKKFIFKSPIDIAKETIEYVKMKEKEKNNIKFTDLIKGKERIFFKNREDLQYQRKKIRLNNESISTNCSSAVNSSNFINNSIYYTSNNKSKINIKFQDIYCPSERITYSNYGKNLMQKKLKINLEYAYNEKNNDNFTLNPKNLVETENKNKIRKINPVLKTNNDINYTHRKKHYKNCSSPNVFKNTDIVSKNNLREQISNNKVNHTLLDKDIKFKNNIAKKGTTFRNNNNINFNYDKLNELCKKMNFDVFSNKKKLNI